ncbi:MAG: exodeoxyribonuclease VII large subunit [Coriobacteriia bacterium]|nr:exodeoxyribonuclease VII large subunit [Coriobacteriia bacterium]
MPGFQQTFSPLGEEGESKSNALSVSAAMALAKTSLEQLVVTMVGEVSEVSDKAGYKAVYFTVKDDRSSLPCMMWMNRYHATGVVLNVGALVELTGRFTLYAAKGRMNFDVFSLRLAGEGNLRMQVAQLAQKLQAEGLMAPERKRPIPKYPESIGLVTSPRGAAVHDVLRTLRRRFPLATVRLAGVPVEGRDAPLHLRHALETVAQSGVEVVLLVRGGGSFEDLMPFNDEGLARAIAACPVPVVTGIGHEPDTSIADMVADVRASTPTAAAEAVSARKENLDQGFLNAAVRLERAAKRTIDGLETSLEAIASRPALNDPQAIFAQDSLGLDALATRMHRAIPIGISKDRSALEHSSALLSRIGSHIGATQGTQLDEARRRITRAGTTLSAPYERDLAVAASRLNDLSPLTVLSRGYAIARDSERHVVKSINQVSGGDHLEVSVSDGTISCTVD